MTRLLEVNIHLVKALPSKRDERREWCEDDGEERGGCMVCELRYAV